MAEQRTPSAASTCPGCGQPVSECQADDVDEWTYTTEAINPNDPLIAAPRWREALERIADPSYVGSYEPEAVIDIYRTWARAALMGP